MIYFLLHKPSASVKIGKADVLLGRLRELALGYPVLEDFVLLGTVDGGYEEEHSLHVEFGDYCLRGEWFSVKGKLKIYLERFNEPKSLADLMNRQDKLTEARSSFWKSIPEQTLSKYLFGRYLDIAIRYRNGETMEQIAQSESCSRQRIHQILRSCRNRVYLSVEQGIEGPTNVH